MIPAKPQPPKTAPLLLHRFISPNTASALERQDGVSYAGASLETSARRSERRLISGTLGRRLPRWPGAVDIASSPETLARRWNARAMSPAPAYLPLQRFVSTHAGPALERRGVVSFAGAASRTLLRLPIHRPGVGTLRRCFPRRPAVADIGSASATPSCLRNAGAMSPALANRLYISHVLPPPNPRPSP